MFTENFSLTGLTGTFQRMGVFRTIRYDEGTATGGVAPTIRVTSLQGNKIDFEMKPGRIVNLTEPINGLIIKNASTGANITGKISYGDGQVTDTAITGAVDLNTNTIQALTTAAYKERPEAPTATYKSTANITANTAEQLVAPGANVAGIIVQEAKICLFGGAAIALGAFITKTSAPATVTDGDPVLYAGLINTTSGGNTVSRGDLDGDTFIPAGQGLYFICDTAIAVAAGGQARMCRYRVL